MDEDVGSGAGSVLVLADGRLRGRLVRSRTATTTPTHHRSRQTVEARAPYDCVTSCRRRSPRSPVFDLHRRRARRRRLRRHPWIARVAGLRPTRPTATRNVRSRSSSTARVSRTWRRTTRSRRAPGGAPSRCSSTASATRRCVPRPALLKSGDTAYAVSGEDDQDDPLAPEVPERSRPLWSMPAESRRKCLGPRGLILPGAGIIFTRGSGGSTEARRSARRERPRQESNPQPPGRNRLLYPLSHGGRVGVDYPIRHAASRTTVAPRPMCRTDRR